MRRKVRRGADGREAVGCLVFIAAALASCLLYAGNTYVVEGLLVLAAPHLPRVLQLSKSVQLAVIVLPVLLLIGQWWIFFWLLGVLRHLGTRGVAAAGSSRVGPD